MRKLLVLSVIAGAVVATSTAQAASSKEQQVKVQLKRFYHADGYYHAIWNVAGRTVYSPSHRIRRKWVRAARWLASVREDARQKIEHLRSPPIPHLSSWVCIHKYEGSWDSNTGNGYYGGLQMDLGFQQTYGPALLRAKGTADHWTPQEQMEVAEVAYKSRGFYPWPNTARYCGLI